MKKALLLERRQFVEIMIVNGFSMTEFLTVQNLRDLYNSADWPHLRDQISRFFGLNLGLSDSIYLR